MEGRRTEPAIYSSWLEILLPGHSRVRDLSALRKAENAFIIISGGGYPQYLRLVEQAVGDAEDVGADHLMVAVDVEEDQPERVASRIDKCLSGAAIPTTVVLQNPCIETWLLGNRAFVRRSPQTGDLQRFAKHYDVRMLDPELMPPMAQFPTRAQVAVAYIKAAFRERRVTYSKRRPAPATDRTYLREVIRRFEDDDIQSFGTLFEFAQRHGVVPE